MYKINGVSAYGSSQAAARELIAGPRYHPESPKPQHQPAIALGAKAAAKIKSS